MPSDLDRYRADLSGTSSDAEETLWGQLRARSLSSDPLPMPVRQFPWVQAEREAGRPFPVTAKGNPRGWTADFAWPQQRLLMEIDGAIFSVKGKPGARGGHTSGTGYTEDRERDAEALCCGWRTLRVTTNQVESGQALTWCERLVSLRQDTE